MDKAEIIDQLTQARSKHIKWRSHAQAIVAGIPVDPKDLPVKHTNCEFGRWYYGPGRALSRLDSYAAIESPHTKLHQVYNGIHIQLLGGTAPSVITRVLNLGKRDKPKHKQDVGDLLKELLTISELLMDSIDLLERDVMDMTDEELAGL